MRILILGATGRTGRQLIAEALRQGYTINVLVRDKSKLLINSDLVTVYEGMPANQTFLRKAMEGCEAVLSTLNISRTSDFPWAALRTPKDFLSASMKTIIKIAGQLNIKRIIITTAWGVGETKKDIPYWFRWLIDNSNIGYAYRDHDVQEELLKSSTLNWTIVRPVGLTNSVAQKDIRVSLNVARFMLDVLQNNSYSKQMPVIS
jgi:uncharacterized protein YbjT (DUF2867 family)